MKELTIKETQQISLEILHTVSEICEEQQIRYALIYGTLIGAVRHPTEYNHGDALPL